MTTIEDVQGKVSDAQETFSEIIEQLKSFLTIKKSLVSTDKSIKEASEKLVDLAESLNKGAIALKNSAESMTSAINLLKGTDPALINENINKVLTEVEILKTQFEVSNNKNLTNWNSINEKLERIEKRKGILF
jgi:hypothetical protein